MHAKTCDRLLILCLTTLLFFPGLVSGAERRSAVVEVVAKAGPAVVNIRTEEIVKSGGGQPFGFSDPFFEEFFQSLVPPQTYTTQSLGSGVIIDAQGHILTNAHVVEKASKIFVALADSREEVEAVLVGKANFIDLAVIKIPSREVQAI
jgi:serine protease Do